MALKKRPITSSDADLERVLSHFDEQVTTLALRKAEAISNLSSSADLATVIRKVNEIIDNLKKVELVDR